MKTPCDKLTKISTKYFGHMTKMAAMPIYGKKPFKNLLLQNKKADDLVCSIEDVGPSKFVKK